jgi:hypothetical protein
MELQGDGQHARGHFDRRTDAIALEERATCSLVFGDFEPGAFVRGIGEVGGWRSDDADFSSGGNDRKRSRGRRGNADDKANYQSRKHGKLSNENTNCAIGRGMLQRACNACNLFLRPRRMQLIITRLFPWPILGM